jgi:hypothetical protein
MISRFNTHIEYRKWLFSFHMISYKLQMEYYRTVDICKG